MLAAAAILRGGRRMNPDLLEAMLVKDVMDRWPDTVRVFVRRGMNCVGCAMSHLMTVAEAAGSYNLPVTILTADLREVIRAIEGHR
jgi:hybrid cluster-associated redox disulfide protein